MGQLPVVGVEYGSADLVEGQEERVVPQRKIRSEWVAKGCGNSQTAVVSKDGADGEKDYPCCCIQTASSCLSPTVSTGFSSKVCAQMDY